MGDRVVPPVDATGHGVDRPANVLHVSAAAKPVVGEGGQAGGSAATTFHRTEEDPGLW